MKRVDRDCRVAGTGCSGCAAMPFGVRKGMVPGSDPGTRFFVRVNQVLVRLWTSVASFRLSVVSEF